MAIHKLWRLPRGGGGDDVDGDGDSDSDSDSDEEMEKEMEMEMKMKIKMMMMMARTHLLQQQQLSPQEFEFLEEAISRHHHHTISPHQCFSFARQRIRAPVDLVWSVVRRFDNPQAYKRFVKNCSMQGDGRVGSTREVELVSGLPAVSSKERLEILDEERRVLSFRIVGGEHRLRNYRSFTSLHEECQSAAAPTHDGKPPGGTTIVIESYVVDVPPENSVDDTRFFIDTIVKYNLATLARISEAQARRRGILGGENGGDKE